MEKMFYVGRCPICCEYGRLEINKDITNNEYLIICEECLVEWRNPQDALRNVKGQRCFRKGEIRAASFKEIRELGWERFIVNIES